MTGFSFPFVFISFALQIISMPITLFVDKLILPPWEDFVFMNKDKVWSIGDPWVYIQIYIVIGLLAGLYAFKKGLLNGLFPGDKEKEGNSLAASRSQTNPLH
jgi:hypothetical protein